MTLGEDTLMTLRDVESLRQRVHSWRKAGLSVAVVPTMGALHRGHIHLMERAQAIADRVIATIFVNPTQFGPNEDFASYPRQEARDLEMLEKAHVHALFAPTPGVMYPPGFATSIHVGGLTDVLCGPLRPGHFDGVATVVTKLLMQTQPDMALFGEKDFQQLAVIKRAVADLNIPVDVLGVPTVREADGLAMSSRNAYLTESERAVAPTLYRAISAVAHSISQGASPILVIDQAKAQILAAGFRSIDYVEARHAETLALLQPGETHGRVLAAAYLGRARLIDNVAIG